MSGGVTYLNFIIFPSISFFFILKSTPIELTNLLLNVSSVYLNIKDDLPTSESPKRRTLNK